MAETADEAVEPIKQKTCVLKASIHCEGCKRKVKKILSQVQGVEFVDVDTKQQKVTVYGSADADTLMKKLAKSGKHAELWPQQKPEKMERFSGDGKNKEKETQTHTKIDPQEPNPTTSDKQPEPSTKVQQAAKREADSGAEESGGGAAAAKGVNDALVKKRVEETKPEEEKKATRVPHPPDSHRRRRRKRRLPRKVMAAAVVVVGRVARQVKRRKRKGKVGILLPVRHRVQAHNQHTEY
ncbi:hypothetical protein DH2020_003257 [Rehmannia glutinosa]|uniref:HMA domain-containing protein n=1 Tax=Rehmannia glutinosa TaxID=99300 RepID=A0ABR0XL48_REHGL